MKTDTDKIDDMTLALMYLVMWDEKDVGSRAWKGFEFETLDRLHQKGWINNPKGKAKSVAMTAEGREKAQRLFEKYFSKEVGTKEGNDESRSNDIPS